MDTDTVACPECHPVLVLTSMPPGVAYSEPWILIYFSAVDPFLPQTAEVDRVAIGARHALSIGVEFVLKKTTALGEDLY